MTSSRINELRAVRGACASRHQQRKTDDEACQDPSRRASVRPRSPSPTLAPAKPVARIGSSKTPFAQLFIEAAGASFAPAASESSIDIRAMRAEYVAIRTRYFDDALLAAAADGCRQVVFLAAGLDTRAFRLNWPDGTRLFELDMPDVLTFKDQVLAEHRAQPTCERHVVEADLRGDWSSGLRAASWHPEETTAWLGEGILMYLAEPERDTLVARVTAGSAMGSRLALGLPV